MIRGEGMTWAAPDTVEAAVGLLSRESGIAILAGGTDLVPRMKHGLIQPRGLLSLGRIGALRQIGPVKEGFRIGAGVTLTDLSAHPAVLETFPALAGAARWAASPQIRSIGTIGGNILQNTRCLYYNQSELVRKGRDACRKAGRSVIKFPPAGRAGPSITPTWRRFSWPSGPRPSLPTNPEGGGWFWPISSGAGRAGKAESEAS